MVERIQQPAGMRPRRLRGLDPDDDRVQHNDGDNRVLKPFGLDHLANRLP
jgi:hypothetical protein